MEDPVYRVTQMFSALIKIGIAVTYIINFSLMHFRKKNCEFFSQIFKKLRNFANFFIAVLLQN